MLGLGTSPGRVMRLRLRRGSARGTADSSACVYGCRGAEERLVRGVLGYLSEVHHHDAVGDVAHDREVVGDEQVRQVVLFLEVKQEIENLCLDRHVECRHGLVAHDEVGVEGHGAGDADALALPTRDSWG